MLEAFMEDKTNFKLWMVVKILLGVILLFGSLILHNEYIAKRSGNLSLNEKYKAQGAWLQHFDYEGTSQLEREILKPVKQQDVHSIINRQIEILKKHGLAVENAVTTEFKAPLKTKRSNAKTNVVNSVKTTVSLKGNWEELKEAFNEFERENLVSITDVNISLVKNTNSKSVGSASGKKLNVKFSFATYYM